MVALIQRVRKASVVVEGDTVGAIDQGLLVFLGVHESDTEEQAVWLAGKCARLRVFSDAEDRMNLSLTDIGGGALVVSQFTLYGDASRGNRPSFTNAAPPGQADALYQRFVTLLEERIGTAVETGIFGATMDVHIVNDGPVTLWVERLAE